MPQAYYQDPQRVKDGMVTYANGVTTRVTGLGRQDLMKLAGAIAKSKGQTTGGTSWTNEQFRTYLSEAGDWQAEGGQDGQENQGDPEARIPVPVTFKCGHTVTCKVKVGRKESTVKWLQTKDCYSCKRGLKPPQEDAPQEDPQETTQEDPKAPESKQEAPKADVDEVVAKVLAKLREVPMPDLHHEALPLVISAIKAGVNPWLQGGPGTAKSTIAMQAAEALGLDFHLVVCHEYMSTTDLFGYQDAAGQDHRTPFRDAFENGGVVLFDEIDNGNSNILAALNAAMANGVAVFCGKVIKRHKDCVFMAAANTAGMGPEAGFLGRQGVDRATLDRFFTMHIGIDGKLEAAVCKAINPVDSAAIITAVRKLRKEADNRGLDIIVSPRTTFDTAKLMAGGFSLADALQGKAFKGLDAMTTKSLLQALGLEGGR